MPKMSDLRNIQEEFRAAGAEVRSMEQMRVVSRGSEQNLPSSMDIKRREVGAPVEDRG